MRPWPKDLPLDPSWFLGARSPVHRFAGVTSYLQVTSYKEPGGNSELVVGRFVEGRY